MKVAVIKVGDKSIEVPVHEEIVDAIKSCQNGLLDIPYQFQNFIRSFLPQETVESYIDFDGVKVPFIEKSHIMDSLEFGLTKGMPDEYAIDTFSELARNIIPSSMRPPSEKQLWFAKKIAATLNIDFPTDAGKSVADCSEFIDKFDSQFREEQANNKSIATFARKGGRGYVSLLLLLKEKGDVAALMGVAKQETIKKYIRDFAIMVEKYASFELNQQKLCLAAINELFIYNYEHLSLQALPIDDAEIMSEKFKAMLEQFIASNTEK